ncbi:MAG: SPOR domain-containing protein [Bacteroidales bacterium]|nr:SPOR domain-containing protein [Bacteroidales bacterium]
MNIVYNLKKFFTEQQDEAAIPGLGVFYKSTIDEKGNKLPEGKFVVLFIEKTPRSNAFVNFLGYEENLTENEAIEVIENWVSSILNDLKTTKVANIPELGRFEIQKDKVEFIPAAPTQDLEPKTEYGLEEQPKISAEKPMASRPSEVVKEQRTTAAQPNLYTERTTTASTQKSNKRGIVFIIIIAILVVLAGGGVACYKTVPKFEQFVDRQITSIRDAYNSARTQTAKPIIIATGIEPENHTAMPIDNDVLVEDAQMQIEASVQQPVKAPPVTQLQQPAKKTEENTFKVIGGAFSIKANAERFHAKMKKDGYTSELFFDNNKQLYYVTLGAFSTEAEALEFKEKTRRTSQIESWIYRK